MSKTHELRADVTHSRWQSKIEPLLEIEPGDTVILWCRDGFDGQMEGLSAETLQNNLHGAVDFRRVAPVTGPISIRGAAPGDVLEVRIKELVPHGTAHMVVFPAWLQGDFLPLDYRNRFPEAWIRAFDMDKAVRDGFLEFAGRFRIPLQPMLGMVATAPAAGEFVTGPPQNFGGNMDVKDVRAGSTVYLPVLQAGGLFSAGDAHALQGDGEISTTGMETPIKAVLEFALHHERSIAGPQLETATEFMTIGRGRSLDLAAQEALTMMLDYLVERHAFTPHDAYAFLGLAGDIRVNQVVNFPLLGARVAIPKTLFADWRW
jgi:acetamidase/formamidase